MRYFTREIWAGWQGDEAAFERANRQWKRNLSRYNASLKRVARRLGPQGKFFTEHSLHDGSLLLFAVRDCPGRRSAKKHVAPETMVEAAVLAGVGALVPLPAMEKPPGTAKRMCG